MIPKRHPYRNKKILESARGEECTVQAYGICNGNTETTVAAHSNYAEDGKGMGQKSDDCFSVYACSACHDLLDGRIPNVGHDLYELFHRALKRTWRRMLDKGVLK